MASGHNGTLNLGNDIEAINGLQEIGDDIGLGGELIQDTVIDLNDEKLRTTGTGEIDFKATLPSGAGEAGFQAGDDILDLMAILGLPSGIKGTGIFFRDGITPDSMVGRFFLGDSTATGGTPHLYSFGYSALDNSKPESVANGESNGATGDANLRFNVRAKGAGEADLRFRSESEVVNGATQYFEIFDGTTFRVVSMTNAGFQIGSYRLPWDDGTSDQILVTDGSGNLTWEDKPVTVYDRHDTQSISGTHDIDFESFETHKLTATATTTITESNLPPTGFSKTIIILATGDITIPAIWNLKGDPYNSTLDNRIVLMYDGTDGVFNGTNQIIC